MKWLRMNLFFVIACTGLLPSCAPGNDRQTAGSKLARQYCASCHQFPEPESLDKKTWANFVLPKMSGMLGFLHMDQYGGYVESGKEVMKMEEWNSLVRYYLEAAPEKLPANGAPAIRRPVPGFTPRIPLANVANPATTFVAIDSSSGNLYFGDGSRQRLYEVRSGVEVHDSVATGKGISHLRRSAGSLLVMTMGVLYPSDSRQGQLVQVANGGADTLLDSLQRPVHGSYADLNGDGREDIVICEFGNSTGRLAWFANTGGNTFMKHILRELPGAVRTEIKDFNGDGRPDILALMAQGDEGFFMYYNEGDGQFREERILQLPPFFGSNYFELADMNGDGFQDIVATNGDNGDYPPILKPYHGIRLYLNDGNNHFSERLFLPVNGASKAIVRDFDNDGDPDIASIAYFPDYEHRPEEAFVFWQNRGDLRFDGFSARETNLGRWLTMDAGDIDRDGDVDIVLGNTPFQLGYVPPLLRKRWAASSPPVLVLENTWPGPPVNKKTRH